MFKKGAYTYKSPIGKNIILYYNNTMILGRFGGNNIQDPNQECDHTPQRLQCTTGEGKKIQGYHRRLPSTQRWIKMESEWWNYIGASIWSRNWQLSDTFRENMDVSQHQPRRVTDWSHSDLKTWNKRSKISG